MSPLVAEVPKRLAGIVVFSLALACGQGHVFALTGGGPARPKAVPALDDFAQIPVPNGNFKAWCGRKDRILVGVDGYLQAFDGSTRVSAPTLSVTFTDKFQCDEDGRELAYVDKAEGRVIKVNIESGSSEILATFDVPNPFAKSSRRSIGTIDISPSLRVIATNEPTLTLQARDVKIVQISPNPSFVLHVRWSEDSSKLFCVWGPDGSVEVMDLDKKKLGSGPLPRSTSFRNGWFSVDGESVFLYVVSNENESGPGFLVSCKFADWKCGRLKSNIEELSIGGRGRAGTISPYRVKPSPDDYESGSIPIHPRYLAELLDSQSRILARQVLLTLKDKSFFRLHVSPRGTKAVLTWDIERNANCVPPRPAVSHCIEAKMFDLSRGIR